MVQSRVEAVKHKIYLVRISSLDNCHLNTRRKLLNWWNFVVKPYLNAGNAHSWGSCHDVTYTIINVESLWRRFYRKLRVVPIFAIAMSIHDFVRDKKMWEYFFKKLTREMIVFHGPATSLDITWYSSLSLPPHFPVETFTITTSPSGVPNPS